MISVEEAPREAEARQEKEARMTQALVLDGHDLARDLYSLVRELHTLLRDLDPARWRDELEEAFRARLEHVSAGIRRAMEALEASSGMESLRTGLGELVALIDEYTPSADLPAARLREEWDALRRQLQQAYEALAQQLRPYDIQAPSLRPTNYARNVLHAGSGLFAAWMILTWLTPASMLGVAHPHEAHHINSSTWFSTSLTVLAVTSSPLACAMGVLVLGIADPAAALVGRRFGRTKLVHGRSLEGTLSFVLAGTLAGLAMLHLYFPELGWPTALALALGGTIPGALTELYSHRLDDNLTIPLAVAAGAGLVMMVLGLG